MVDHEATEREILQLVNEADGRDRAMLLLIYRMHQELVSNTIATRQIASASEDHARTLRQHADDEMALINQIRGGWQTATRAGSLVVLLLTIIFSGVQWFALRELQAIQAAVATNSGRLAVLESDNAVQRDQIWSIRSHLRNKNNDPLK